MNCDGETLWDEEEAPEGGIASMLLGTIQTALLIETLKDLGLEKEPSHLV